MAFVCVTIEWLKGKFPDAEYKEIVYDTAKMSLWVVVGLCGFLAWIKYCGA